MGRQPLLMPRKTHWTEDENKFGQKLLEKMGWKKGSGLGKDGQGDPEVIKVAIRSDKKGVGWDDSANDVWKESNFQYEQLLQELNKQHAVQNLEPNTSEEKSISAEDGSQGQMDGSGDTADPCSGKRVSLRLKKMEKSSKKLRKRIHYHKFVRAKDLSRCSEKDLKAIFAIKPIESDKNSIVNKTSNDDGDVNAVSPAFESTESDEKPKEQVLVTQQLSVNDYFAQKLAAKRKQSSEQDPKSAKKRRLNDADVDDLPKQDLEASPTEEIGSESTTISIEESIPADDIEIETESEEKSEIKSVKGRVRFSLDLEAIKFFDKRLPPCSISFVADDDDES